MTDTGEIRRMIATATIGDGDQVLNILEKICDAIDATKGEAKMRCDYCKQPMNYCFYIDDAYWIKVVGEERFDKNVGHVCAHCTLERLGGLDWQIVWNEPTASTRPEMAGESETYAAPSTCNHP